MTNSASPEWTEAPDRTEVTVSETLTIFLTIYSAVPSVAADSQDSADSVSVEIPRRRESFADATSVPVSI